MNFLIGSLSGMIATTVIQPIDCVKVQIQVRSEAGSKNVSPFKIAKEIYQEKKSIKAFYVGYDSAMMRQLVYTGTRLGIFYSAVDLYKKEYKKAPGTLVNSLLSLFSGALGAFVGNPADLALVRMQNDLNEKPENRRNYKNVFDALGRTVKEEGLFALWRGSFPTIARAMAMNFSLLVPFEAAKKNLKPYISNDKLRTITSSCISGVCASILSLPFDNVKTKLQKMKKGENGQFPYKGIVDCFTKTSHKEGIAKLWVGLPTYYVRVAPHAIISLATNEFLRGFLMNSKKK